MEKYLDTSPTNRFGEHVVAHVLTDPDGSKPAYRCREESWQAALADWRTDWRNAPQPMPSGHCMFIHPARYGRIPLGCTHQPTIRRAIRQRVVSNLHGWDAEMRKTRAGMRKLARIVRHAVGHGMDAGHYVACVMTW